MINKETLDRVFNFTKKYPGKFFFIGRVATNADLPRDMISYFYLDQLGQQWHDLNIVAEEVIAKFPNIKHKDIDPVGGYLYIWATD
ncbi:MAG: hypothetical protein HQK52_16920 [Oligoflexia bacterium]|nr:hypothetical protein [Oligoflexia bacterium]